MRCHLIYSLPATDIEKFVDLTELLRQLEPLTLDRLESVAVQKLRFALEQKAKGAPYARIPVLAFDEEGNESTNPRDLML